VTFGWKASVLRGSHNIKEKIRGDYGVTVIFLHTFISVLACNICVVKYMIRNKINYMCFKLVVVSV
jgi:hypothetical protein